MVLFKNYSLFYLRHPSYLKIVYKTIFGLDVVYDQPSNDSFSNKLETAQYNAALAITGAITGVPRKKLYQELGLEIFNREDGWGPCLFYEVVSTKLPAYTYDFIPPWRQSQGNPNTLNSFSCRTEYHCTECK